MLIYKLWARVEVYDTDKDEHYDVDPEIAEFKVGEFAKVEDVAGFIVESWDFNSYDETYNELKYALDQEG